MDAVLGGGTAEVLGILLPAVPAHSCPSLELLSHLLIAWDGALCQGLCARLRTHPFSVLQGEPDDLSACQPSTGLGWACERGRLTPGLAPGCWAGLLDKDAGQGLGSEYSTTLGPSTRSGRHPARLATGGMCRRCPQAVRRRAGLAELLPLPWQDHKGPSSQTGPRGAERWYPLFQAGPLPDACLLSPPVQSSCEVSELLLQRLGPPLSRFLLSVLNQAKVHEAVRKEVSAVDFQLIGAVAATERHRRDHQILSMRRVGLVVWGTRS